ncbi:MAG TPA: hypothetical protein VK505_09655 [Steroidobacteraceae bacterium]|nr:hypothetical protein [Steroidobacteraceae bacterium]
MRKLRSLGLITTVALLLGACSNQMEPAQQAIAGIDSAIASASPDAGKYVPEELATVKGKLADLKSAFDKKDYVAVLAGAPAVLSEAQNLLGDAAMKKDVVIKAMGGEWTSLAATVPPLVAAVSKRVMMLDKLKHPPAGVDLAAAKTNMSDATALWSKAQAAFAAGNVEEAVTSARDVKAKAVAAAAAIKLSLPKT